MRGNSLCLLLTLAVLARAHVKPCKYWCRMNGHRYYCCPSGKGDSWSGHGWHSLFFPWFWLGVGEAHVESTWHEPTPMQWKPPRKRCPPVRTHCPRTYNWYRPPEFCDGDHDCDGWEKCCYDVCLEHKTCKDAE